MSESSGERRLLHWHRKRQAIRFLGSKCVRCSETDIIVLSFHHLREKKFNVASVLGKKAVSWEEIETELNKCVLLCFNCHAREHHTYFR